MSLELPSGVNGTLVSSAPAERRREPSPLERLPASAQVQLPVRFADADARERACRDAAAARSIVLRPRADAPGTLASCIDGDFESALALRGAVPPLVGEGASLEERLADQLARASALPVKGLCLALPPLGGCIESDGVLADADARYLGAWWRSASLRPIPITMIFDEQDRALTARVPRSLETVLADLFFSRAEPLELEVPTLAADEGLSIPDLCEIVSAAEVTEPAIEEAPPAAPAAEPVRRQRPARGAAPTPAGFARAMKETLRERMAAHVEPPAPDPVLVAPTVEPEGPTLAELHAHAMELDAARGPRPVAAIERLFAEHYVPLLGHVASGAGDAGVRSVAETWSQSFRESYTEGFSALRVTPRRPTMVFDAYDIAARISRVASARSIKLLLVDSMSFDLGERVAARMRILLDRRAVLVERTTLWSALPTSTPTQMTLLARGAEGLKETAPASEPDIARGRNIGSLRRERLGSRELMKLDLVEARLRAPGAAYDERLDGIADEVADVVSSYLESLPPRTLLLVFGDHGFVLADGANGWATGPASQGGASPEEVLVSAHAWLADAMH